MKKQSNFKGQEIRGYQLRALIGSGGSAEVYRAFQPAIEREVAIKIILPSYANHPHFIRRFEAEAQLIARLEHIHIVPLYDFWREPDSAYLVMRWLRGGSLRRFLVMGQPLDASLIGQVVVQISSALATAHRSGIIHQDLKPDNILLDNMGNTFLADFGIAKDLRSNRPEDEELGFGTPIYVSPEQILHQPMTPRADIYSLGIMMYELLTGRPPFIDADERVLLEKHVKEPLPSLQAARPDLPRQLSMVLWRACSKQPEARYPDVMSFAAEFIENFPDGVLPILQTPALPLSASDLGSDTAKILTSGTLIIQRVVEIQNPFKGLRPFQEADTADFFGREALTEHLLNVMDAPSDPVRLLTVIGPSGSGKSSLIRAGLIPSLRRGMLPGSETWYIAQMTPGDDPFKALESALLQVAVNAPLSLLEWLRIPGTGLVETVNRIIPIENVQLVLFIDQFEELFTLVEDEAERKLFLEILHIAATSPQSPLRIILSLRADFYDRPLLYPEFGALVRAHTEVVLPLSPGELEQAVTGPAARVGLELERGLVPAIVADVSQQPGALPLLQYALTELFERRTEDILTMESYRQIGGVAGALARRAESLYEGLNADSKAAVRQLFLQIIAAGDGLEEVRRRVTLPTLLESAQDQNLMQQVIDLFGRYRLLAFDRESATRMPTVEIAHEALIREWHQLREWLDANRDEVRMYRRLAAAAADWTRAERDASYLASGARLGQFTALAESGTIALSEDEKSYVQAGIALRQQTINRLRAFIAVLLIALAATLGLAGFAYNRQQQAQKSEAAAVIERDRADQQANISNSRELAIRAMTGDQPDVSLLLSLEALQAAHTFEARSSLLASLQMEPQLFTFLHGHLNSVRAVSVSADGSLLASGGRENTIRLWNLETYQPIAESLEGHEDWINALAFAPTGDVLASASADGTVRLWDVTTGEQTRLLTVEDVPIWGLAVSADGSEIAASTADGRILRWNMATGNPIGEPLISHDGIVYGVAFSPDGQWLASAGDDNAVRLWRLNETLDMQEIAVHDNWALSVVFSPDGSLLASGGADSTIIIWDMQSQQILQRIATGHNAWIRDLVFEPSGHILASTGADGSIRLWDIASGIEVMPPLEHHAEVWSAAFTPSGDFLAAGDADGRVILWDVMSRYTLGKILGYHHDAVFSTAFSPDGQHIVSGGGDPALVESDNALHMWTLGAESDKRATPTLLEGHSGPVTEAVYSPDGQHIASSGADGSIMVWNSLSGEQERLLIGEHGSINAVVYSPDGKYIAGAAEDGTLLLWADSGDLGEAIPISDSRLYKLVYSPDGRLLATGGEDGSISLWNTVSQEQIGLSLTGHTDSIMALDFSPDGSLLASGSRDGSIILWDVTTQQALENPLAIHTNWVLSVDFSPDGSLLASGSRDGSIILWDIESGRVMGNPMTVGSGDWVYSVKFNSDGTSLITGSRDGAVILWDISLESWQKRACRIANRGLTPVEWSQYVGEAPYAPHCD